MAGGFLGTDIHIFNTQTCHLAETNKGVFVHACFHPGVSFWRFGDLNLDVGDRQNIHLHKSYCKKQLPQKLEFSGLQSPRLKILGDM